MFFSSINILPKTKNESCAKSSFSSFCCCRFLRSISFFWHSIGFVGHTGINNKAAWLSVGIALNFVSRRNRTRPKWKRIGRKKERKERIKCGRRHCVKKNFRTRVCVRVLLFLLICFAMHCIALLCSFEISILCLIVYVCRYFTYPNTFLNGRIYIYMRWAKITMEWQSMRLRVFETVGGEPSFEVRLSCTSKITVYYSKFQLILVFHENHRNKLKTIHTLTHSHKDINIGAQHLQCWIRLSV